MKRPTIKQLNIVRHILGNGWGDGDFLEYCRTKSEKRSTILAVQSFERWLEYLQGAEFKYKTIGGK